MKGGDERSSQRTSAVTSQCTWRSPSQRSSYTRSQCTLRRGAFHAKFSGIGYAILLINLLLCIAAIPHPRQFRRIGEVKQPGPNGTPSGPIGQNQRNQSGRDLLSFLGVKGTGVRPRWKAIAQGPATVTFFQETRLTSEALNLMQKRSGAEPHGISSVYGAPMALKSTVANQAHLNLRIISSESAGISPIAWKWTPRYGGLPPCKWHVSPLGKQTPFRHKVRIRGKSEPFRVEVTRGPCPSPNPPPACRNYAPSAGSDGVVALGAAQRRSRRVRFCSAVGCAGVSLTFAP